MSLSDKLKENKLNGFQDKKELKEANKLKFIVDENDNV